MPYAYSTYFPTNWNPTIEMKMLTTSRLSQNNAEKNTKLKV